MEQSPENHNNPDHIIDIERDGDASDLNHHDQAPVTDQERSSSSNSMTNLAARRGHDGAGNTRSRIPSICEARVLVPLISTLSQMTASIVILVLSRDKNPPILLVAWVKGYTAGCAATLPLIFSQSYPTLERFENFPLGLLHALISLCEEDQDRQNFSSNRLIRFYKIALDIFFVFLCVSGIPLGNLSSSEGRDVYRLFVVFFIFTFVWYGGTILELVLLLCAIAWVILFYGIYGNTTAIAASHENLNQTREASANFNQNRTRDSSAECMYSLPTYKYELQKNRSGESGEEASSGVVAAGTEKERHISGDDAVCCICLATYVNNDELKELPCSHLFHSYCVDKWLQINASCPLCKQELGERTLRLPSTAIAVEQV